MEREQTPEARRLAGYARRQQAYYRRRRQGVVLIPAAVDPVRLMQALRAEGRIDVDETPTRAELSHHLGEVLESYVTNQLGVSHVPVD